MTEPTYQNLAEESQRLREENRQLRVWVETLEAHVQKLTALLEQAQWTGKRQAAPFSIGTPKPDPKTPGRKPAKDYGRKAHRLLPEQKHDESIDVPLPCACPDCGGLTERDHVEQQSQVDILRRPVVRRLDRHLGRCRRCGRRLPPRHPLQTSNATGAAASQLGPHLQVLIARMKDKYGLRYGDIQGLLDEVSGTVSRGGAVQVVLRVAERHEPAYRAIEQIVCRSAVVYPDETGRRIDGWPQRPWSHPGNRRFQKHLGNHWDRILTFLCEPDLEATNWPAEQVLHPLVVNRTALGGNRTPACGQARELLGRVFATSAKQGLDGLSLVSRILCLPAAERLGLIRQLLPTPAG